MEARIRIEGLWKAPLSNWAAFHRIFAGIQFYNPHPPLLSNNNGLLSKKLGPPGLSGTNSPGHLGAATIHMAAG
jgi:hypothetical protein